MAIAIPRKKSRQARKTEPQEQSSFFFTILYKFCNKIPTTIFLLLLVFLWSSSSTIFSGKIVHVCVSSRKLNNLYCLSAGTQPGINVTIPMINDTYIKQEAKENGDGSFNQERDSVQVTTQKVKESYNLPITQDHDPDQLTKQEVTENTNVLVNQEHDLVKSMSQEVKQSFNLSQAIRQEVSVKYNLEDEENVKAKQEVEEILQVQRSWAVSSDQVNQDLCDGKGIYVYDLPSKFNKDLLGLCNDMVPWASFCKYFGNEALGEPIEKYGKEWYHTHQYSLEPIFHAKVLKHPCRVYDENQAKLFFVPFYGGLDILRWHFKNVSNDVKDQLGLEMIKWLEPRKSWTQNSGKDHVFVLGKISWDFRRTKDSSWGTRFLEQDQMQNPMKLLIERQPWHLNDIGIPHPTFFHPNSDDDIVSWQLRIIRSERKNLISFAGADRLDHADNIRSILIKQCMSSTSTDKCSFLNCASGGCDNPEPVIDLFMSSEFCLQPPGDSPTRKSVFDSLILGCIPVLFDPYTAYYEYPWHLPEDHRRYSIYIDKQEVQDMKVNVVERLMNVSEREKEDMRSYIVYEMLPGLVYGGLNSKFNKFQDAFSITINNLHERVSRLES